MLNHAVPDFQLPATSGKTFQLSDFTAKNLNKNIALYFYPKDSTPGCTTQDFNLEMHILTFSRLILRFLAYLVIA